GDYARVERVDSKTNHVTVRIDDDRTLRDDPSPPAGRDALPRGRSCVRGGGPRAHDCAPSRSRHSQPELGTVERRDAQGRMGVRGDPLRTSSFEPGERRHLDYGYAVTSHRSQGQTAGRVLVHVEATGASEKLVHQRLAYVAVSRGQYDARICTDDKVELA